MASGASAVGLIIDKDSQVIGFESTIVSLSEKDMLQFVIILRPSYDHLMII
jgi:hypothetical protein